MRKQRGSEPLTSAGIREIVASLRHFAERYESLAKMLDDEKVELIQAKNMSTLRRSINFIKQAVNKAYDGYDEAFVVRNPADKEAAERALREFADLPKTNSEKKSKPESKAKK